MSSKAFRINITDSDKPRLVHAGCTGMVFVQKPIDLAQAVTIIEATTITGRPKIIKREKQLDMFERVLKSPFQVPYTMCISSAFTDIRAKYTAAYLLRRSLDVYDKGRYQTLHLSPEWHTLTGSFADIKRDQAYQLKKKPKPALIVFSNITTTSSEVKIEKLRDLLELYADVPRIVAITGEDPYTFFAHRLQYPLNIGLSLTRGTEVDFTSRAKKGVPPKKPKEQSDDDLPSARSTRPKPRSAKTNARTAEI